MVVIQMSICDAGIILQLTTDLSNSRLTDTIRAEQYTVLRYISSKTGDGTSVQSMSNSLLLEGPHQTLICALIQVWVCL